MTTRQLSPKKPTAARVSSFTRVRSGALQRKCACGGTPPGPSGECEECRKKKLQRKTRSSELGTRNDSVIPPIVHEVLHSSGQPLDAATRAFMEPRFGHDFSQVRVHTDSKAAESARAVNALAYTVGRDVVFGEGQYVPVTPIGKRLIAHELTHTIQQGKAGSRVSEIGQPGDSSEQEASQATEKIMAGTAGAPGILVNDNGVIQRQESEAGEVSGGSAAAIAEADGVTASDARRELIARIGEERYRLLEQRLMGGLAAGESEAESAGNIVAAGGIAPRISRITAMPILQPAGPALPIAGALAAAALCAFGFYFYALRNFPGKDDKWLHCWTSCKIAAWCGGPGISALLGLGKEVVDGICDALGGPCGAEWGDVFADFKGIGCSMVPLLPCGTCCDHVV